MSNFWGAVHIFLSFYSFLIVKAEFNLQMQQNSD